MKWFCSGVHIGMTCLPNIAPSMKMKAIPHQCLSRFAHRCPFAWRWPDRRSISAIATRNGWKGSPSKYLSVVS